MEPRRPTLLHSWQHWVDTTPDATAVWFLGTSLTYLEVDSSAQALAAALADRGVGPGHRVALFLQNDPQYVVATLAAWRLGATPVAVSAMLLGDELEHQLTDSGAVALVCLDSLWERVAAAVVPRTRVHMVVTTHPLDLTPDAEVPDGLDLGGPVPVDGTVRWGDLPVRDVPDVDLPDVERLGFLTYTSGTTGRPKGAMNLHGALAYSSQVYADTWRLEPGSDTVLCVAPLFHITGVVAGLGVAVSAGVPLVLLHRFDLTATLQAIERTRATFMVAASTLYVAVSSHPRLADHDLSSMTKTLSGGAPVSRALVDRVREATGWVLHGAYGMTETNSPTHLGPPGVTPPIDATSGALAVGMSVPGCETRIVDPSTGRDVADGEAGEILVRGPMVVPGYWCNLEATAAVIDDDGWLRTGDIGSQTAEGWLFVVDRLKDMINASGYKVYPREVEDVLQRHEAVLESAVVGVPDEYRGESVKAFVVVREGHHLEPDEVVTFTRRHLASYKCPRVVEVVQSLPRNAGGKVLRRELREAAPSHR